MEKQRTLVIFGADGDLSKRLLLPGLAQLLHYDGDRGVKLIGVGMSDFSAEEWSGRLHDAVGDGLKRFEQNSRYERMDATDADALGNLLRDIDGPATYYFAVPPAVAFAACEALATLDMAPASVLALEKPFGTDLDEAKRFNALLATFPKGVEAFRVDHFLGKTIVLSLIGLRLANRMMESVWNAGEIEKVEIVFDETLALEGRAGYYDKAGALRDMIQSHLLQVLALIGMEPPETLDYHDLHGRMAEVLEATRVWGSNAAESGRRARYTAGDLDSRHLPDYAAEKGVDPDRQTETLAEVTLQINTERWHGVPFVLRSGKALGQAHKQIIVHFRESERLPRGFSGKTGPRTLRMGIDTTTIALDLLVNDSDNALTLTVAELETTVGEGKLGAYGEVLAGLLDADPLLSVSGRAAEACWRIVTPVLEAWADGEVPLDTYPAGSAGPSEWTAITDEGTG